MAVLSITAANVRPDAKNVPMRQYEASEAITAGMAVHLDTATNMIRKGTPEDYFNIVGITLTNAYTTGDIVQVQTGGEYVHGATASTGANGDTYYLYGTGGLSQYADVGTGTVVEIMYQLTATTGFIQITNTGVEI